MSIKYETCEINDGHYLKVLSCFSDENRKNPKPKTLFLIIPGNPGIIEFYEHFALELNQKTNMPVIGISHTGHMYHDNIKHWKPANVKSQVQDKIKFIQEHLDNYLENGYEEIVLIGHSVGCYVILEILDLLEDKTKSRVKKSFLLFPTIERMSETPNGKVLTFATNFFLWFIYFFAFLITNLPDCVRNGIVNYVFEKRHAQEKSLMIDNINDVVLKMSTCFSCVRSCFHMGHDEMGVVKTVNRRAIEKNLDSIYFYYGSSDKWCPVSYFYGIRDLVEEIKGKGNHERNLVLDSEGLDHAFVIFKQQCKTISDFVHKNLEFN